MLFPLSASAQTLDAVRARDHVLCGSNGALRGFAQQGESGFWSGFDVDICRAVATAALGDPNKVEFRPLAGDARFAQLQTGMVDLMARNAHWSLPRDTLYGAKFVGVSFFDGQTILIPSSQGVVSAYDVDDLAICVLDNIDERAALSDFFFVNQTNYSEVIYENRDDLRIAYKAGICDAVSGSASWLNAIRATFDDPAQHRILPERISREPLGPMVRTGDPEWFNIVRWTLFALINAEELGISSQNIDTLLLAKSPEIRRFLGLESDFGSALRLPEDWMQTVIRSVGNYGEIYERHFGSQTGASLPRGLNALWTQGGLHYAPPVR